MSEVNPYIKFKTSLVAERTKHLCSAALEVLNEMAVYCEERKLPLMVTDSVSTPEEDVELARVSDEHAEARAFDLSLKGWLELAIRAFSLYFEKRFLSVAAVSLQTHTPHLIVRHNSGHGDHLHVQVARLYGLKDPLNLKENSSTSGKIV